MRWVVKKWGLECGWFLRPSLAQSPASPWLRLALRCDFRTKRCPTSSSKTHVMNGQKRDVCFLCWMAPSDWSRTHHIIARHRQKLVRLPYQVLRTSKERDEGFGLIKGPHRLKSCPRKRRCVENASWKPRHMIMWTADPIAAGASNVAA